MINTMITILFSSTIIFISSFILLYFKKLRKPKKFQHLPSKTIKEALEIGFSTQPQDMKIRSLSMKELHENKVQLIFRMGEWSVISSSIEASKLVYNDTFALPKVIPAENRPNSVFAKFQGINIVFSNHDIWKRHRRVLNPPFKKQFEISTFEKTIKLFFDVVDNKYFGKDIDVYKYMQRITMDSLGKGLMGIEFDSIIDEEVKFINYYNDIMKASFNAFYFLFHWLDRPWNPYRKVYFEKLEWLESYFKSIIKQKRLNITNNDNSISENKADEDILTLMVKAAMEENIQFTDDEIRDNVMVFLLAGHDTTAFALSATLHFLAQNPDVQEKARQEVMTVMELKKFNINEPNQCIFPTVEQTKEMEYLMAIIKETLRLYPSIPRLPERYTTKDITLNGYFIPKGTKINMDIYSMQRDPEYFDQPENFIPERFLKNSEFNNNSKLDLNAWSPFGGGTRSCIGMNFSLLEQKTVLSMILTRYKVFYAKDKPQANGAPLKLNSNVLFAPDDLRLEFKLLD